jgi:hypothetical protein
VTGATIGFAGCRYCFTGLSAKQADLVRSRFAALLCADDAEPDVQIEIRHDPDAARFIRRPRGPVEYRVQVAHDEESISVAGIGFNAHIDRSPLRAQMQTCLTDAWFLGAFENLLRVVVCHRLFIDGALVMHSAAFTDGSRGFLFCGRSGAGKTTLCSLADQLELSILSDELNAITACGGRLALQAMPFAGDFGGVPNSCPPYPLTGLLGLEHGPSPLLRDCSKAEAVSRIVASCPYVNADPLLVDELTSRVEELVSCAPFRILAFAKDTTFWSILDNEYRRSDPKVSH